MIVGEAKMKKRDSCGRLLCFYSATWISCYLLGPTFVIGPPLLFCYVDFSLFFVV